MNALIFPGQGSQKVGMGKIFVERYAWARELAERTNDILGRNLTKICFEGPEAELKETQNTQPAIFFTSVLIYEAFKKEKPHIQILGVAGHSLGEYLALYAADVADYDELLKLVAIRAELMSNACQSGEGTMAAVLGVEREILEQACKEVSSIGECVIANDNCPGQLVISGISTAVKKASEIALQRGAKKVIQLDVSGPFHSPLMAKAQEKFADFVFKANFKNASIPIYANVDGMPTYNASEIKQKLINQITNPVRWQNVIQNMWNDKINNFIELGPSKVVSTLAKKIIPQANVYFACDLDSIIQINL